MSSGRSSPARAVGRYLIVRELGRGGMGTVYLARDPRLEREVAIKFVSVAGPAAGQRFLAEARVTARCKHPNIVDIYEIDDDGGQPYIVLEYVDGESALAALARGPLAPARAVAIMTQVARGLAFAHSRGIIHRDLKPANILVAGGGVAKIVDFGIAKPFDDDAAPYPAAGDHAAELPRELTGTSELPGTLHYIAPEQARRETTDDRVDLWAFGVTLYQLLAGRRPLEGLAHGEVLAHLVDLDRDVPRLDEVAPGVPPALVDLTHRCLEKRVELRVGSAAELVVALEAVAARLAEPAPVIAPPTTTTARPAPRRRRIALVAAAAVLALAAVVLATRHGRSGPTGRPPIDRAGVSRAEALVAEVGRLDGQGARADGDRLLEAFLADERSPDALALAWLARGDRAQARDGVVSEDAMVSYATAYASAADPAVQRRALLAVTRSYLESWEWDRLAAALEVLAGVAGPDDAELEAQRDRLRLTLRDRAAAATPTSATGRIATHLLQGRPTGLPMQTAATVDVDGDGDLDLVALDDGELVARTGDTLAELSRRPVEGPALLRCAGRDDHGAYAVVTRRDVADRAQLVPLDGGPVVELPQPLRLSNCRWIDLDGRGGDELYLLTDDAVVRWARDAGGAWTERRVAVGSEVWDAVGGDLDGDGRRELILSIGEWRAYEVRLLRVDPDGGLRVVDRIRLGLVCALADLGRDDTGRARIAAIKLDRYPDVRDLPADRPLAAPAGLYVLGLAGDRLEVLRHEEVPGTGGDPYYRSRVRHFPVIWPLTVGDLDGDGRRDVVATIGLASDQWNLLVLLAGEDGGFAPRVISGVNSLAVIPGAGDRAAAIVATIDGDPAAWLLGRGDTAVPRLATALAPAATPPVGLDPSLAATWVRGEQLARIGQVETAAAAFERLASVAGSAGVKVVALRRAADLLGAAGRPAADLLEAIARLPGADAGVRTAAWLDAIADDVTQVALIDGRDRVDRLRSSGLVLAADDEARLAAESARLPAERHPVFDGQALGAGWRVEDPSLVHVVPGSRQLAIETLTPGVVATLPIDADPRGVAVAIDAELTRTEWAGGLVFRLGPRDPALGGGVELTIGARGGGRVYGRELSCTGTFPSEDQQFEPMPDSDAAVTLHLELALVPGQRRARCVIVHDGRRLTGVLDVAPSATRDWALTIAGNEVANMTSATARITSIEVTGAARAPATPSELEAASLALAAHRPAEARALLARLDGPTAATWPAVRLAVMADDELGDRPAAVAALTAALASATADRRQVASLARARDGQFMPVVRAAFGRRVALLLDAAWAVSAFHELVQPRVRAALIRDLDGLPPATAETRDATLSLLVYLGDALSAVGRPDEARRALTDAFALAPADANQDVRDRVERLAVLLAIDAAARGDEPAARRWALTAIERGNYPELAADQILLDPGLRALTAGPGWERVRALGRLPPDLP